MYFKKNWGSMAEKGSPTGRMTFFKQALICIFFDRPQRRPYGRRCHVFYFPGLKPSLRLTDRLNTKAPGLESLLSAQK